MLARRDLLGQRRDLLHYGLVLGEARELDLELVLLVEEVLDRQLLRVDFLGDSVELQLTEARVLLLDGGARGVFGGGRQLLQDGAVAHRQVLQPALLLFQRRVYLHGDDIGILRPHLLAQVF